jgi:hypothetical protein
MEPLIVAIHAQCLTDPASDLVAYRERFEE